MLTSTPLKPLVKNYSNIFDSIISRKNTSTRSRLNAIRSNIIDSYLEYINNYKKNNLEKIKISIISNATDKQILMECYTTSTIGVDSLKKQIKDLQNKNALNLCNYCGIQKPSTLDHYFPQSKYPEYSVLALNLIPCCAQCNQIKDNDVFDSVGNLKFLNFYRDSDSLNRNKFLYAYIKNRRGSLEVGFYLKNKKMANIKLYKRFSNHIEHFDLLNVYKNKSNTEISNIFISLQSVFVAIGHIYSFEEYNKSMIFQYKQYKANFGENYYLTSIYFSLIGNKIFYNYYISNV